jgi:hypothetical protein
MTITIGARSKKLPAELRYTCPVCQRKAQYPGPCGSTCRERATPEQSKPTLQAKVERWDVMQ